jgi:hypothetical protein
MGRNGRFGVLAFAASLLAILLFATSAFASKEVIDYFGSESSFGTKGGELAEPQDVAVNSSGVGPADPGDIYVVDESNNRVQRFDADGDFISTWGADVIQAGKAGDVGGTDPFEICTVAADCKRGAASGGNGATSGNGSLDSPQSIAIDQDTGNVYVSDRDNFRINEYTATGTFIRSFGFDVDATEAATGYEVCPVADVCKAGEGGSGSGQIGSTFAQGPLGIAVSPPDANASSGTVFLADTGNRRIDTYDLDGQNPGSFGSEAQFEEGQPRKVAVDSRGIVYASDSGNGGEIERYDSEDANGGGVAFLAPIAMPPLLEGSSEEATKGLAVDPDSDGGGSDEDVLYVLRVPFSGNVAVQQFGPSNDPGLTTAPTAVDDTHGSGAGFPAFSVRGLGLDEASGRLFVSSNGDVSGTGEANRVYILDNSVAPGASIDPVTTFDAHSATFSGQADPNGVQAAYRFEYVDDAEFLANGFTNAKQVPVTDKRIGSGDTAVSVQQQTPDNLIAGTTYHVRLVAKQVFSSTQTIGGPITFTTDDSAPSIDGAAATVSTEEATLRGTIDPENQAVTDYHFEWGLTSSYGNTTPSASLETGKVPVAISALLDSLTPGATYHYRLVATNASGTTQGPDRIFTTYASLPQLGPERAFELVSPYPTGGVPIVATNALVSVSEDGDRVHFGVASQPLPGTELLPPPDQLHSGESYWRYGSLRDADGWHTKDFGLSTSQGGTYPFFGSGVSADGTRYFLSTTANAAADPRFDPDDQNGTNGNTAVDVYQRQPDGSLVWISRDPRIPVGTPQPALGNAGPSHFNLGMAQMSVDGSTVLFVSARPLDDADTATEGPESYIVSLYKWQEGQLTFIGKRPDGSVPSGGTHLGDWGGSNHPALQGTVSRDGSRVLFSAQRTDTEGFALGTNHTLYIQTDGQPTVEAVKETGVPQLPDDQPFNVIYRGASGDLSRAFFTTSSRLTPDSGGSAPSFSSSGDADLYAYDIDADKVRDLTPRLDGIDDPTVDPATADRGRVRGLVANSEDGKRAYFVADAQYDVAPNPEGELPSPEGRNLYLAELDGIDDPIELRFVAALGAADAAVWQANLIAGGGAQKSSQASPDGSVLGFGSSEPLTGQALGGTNQLFVYDAEADTLKCASCPTDGSLPSGDVNQRDPLFGGGLVWQTGPSYRRWVSSDGRVFFHTKGQLVDGDTNLVDDVYEYRAGSLRLVSAGTGALASRLEDVSRDGGTVIMNTGDTLVPYDEEPGIPKLYAARIGGGFPVVPKQPDCDLGAGACEGPGTASPQQPGAGSAAFEGAGDPKPKKASKRCPKGKRKVRRQGKVRCAPAKTRKHKRDAKNDRRASR